MANFIDIVITGIAILYVLFLTREALEYIEDEKWSEFAYSSAWIVFTSQHILIQWITRRYGLFSLPQNDWLLRFLTWDITFFVVIMSLLITYCINLYVIASTKKQGRLGI